MNLDGIVIKNFRVSERALILVANAISAVYQGVWLGLLNRRQLNQISELQYADWKQFQRLEWNISGLHFWEEKVFGEYFSECKNLLVGAAGGGREVYALMHRGVTVDAFECNSQLVDCCRELLLSKEFKGKVVQARPDEFPDGLGIYSGMILGWGAYIHIPTRLNRIQFLNQCRKHIDSGGNILLSFLIRDGETRSLRWTYEIARVIRKICRSQDKVELGDRLDGTFDHYFTKAEIKAELEEAGFEMVYYANAPYGHAVGRVAVSESERVPGIES